MLERGKVGRQICQAWRAVAIAKINTSYTFFILLVKLLVRLAAREWKLPTPGVRHPAQDICIFVSRKGPEPQPSGDHIM